MKKVTPSHVSVALVLALAFQVTVLQFVSLDLPLHERAYLDALRVQLPEVSAKVSPGTVEPVLDASPKMAEVVPDSIDPILEEPVEEKALDQAPKRAGSPREPTAQVRSAEISEEISEESAGASSSEQYEHREPASAPSISETAPIEPEAPEIQDVTPSPVTPGAHTADDPEAVNGSNLQLFEAEKAPYIPRVSSIRNTPDVVSGAGGQRIEAEAPDPISVTPVEQPQADEPASEIASRQAPEATSTGDAEKRDSASGQAEGRVLRPGDSVAALNRSGIPEGSGADTAYQADAFSPDANSVPPELSLDPQSGEGSSGAPADTGIGEYAFVWSDVVTPVEDATTNVLEDPGATPAKADSIEETDWNRECKDEKNPETCHIVQEIYLHKDVDGKTRNLGRILKLSVSRAANSNAAADTFTISIYLPLGVDLRPGAVIKVDRGADIPLRYLKCTAAGCRADVPIDDALLNAMETGRRLFVGFLPWGGDRNQHYSDVVERILGRGRFFAVTKRISFVVARRVAALGLQHHGVV